MKNIFVSIFFILLCVEVSSIFSACSKGEMPALQRADSLLCEDQAEEAARLLDSVKTAAEAWNEASRMRHALLSAEAQNKRFIPFTDDSLLLAVVDYYEKEGTPFDCMRAYYVMGSVYRDLKWNAQAQEYYHKAVKIADTTDTAQLRLLARVYGQLGELYSKYRHTEEGLEIYKKQTLCGLLSKDTLIAAAGLLKIADFFRPKGPYDSLVYYGQLAERLYAESSHKRLRPKALLSQIHGYIKSKDFNKADSLFKEVEVAISEYSVHRSVYLVEHMNRYIILKGHYFKRKGPLDSAAYYYRKELALGGDAFVGDAYNSLMVTYRKTGIKDSIIKYQRLYIKALRKAENQYDTQILSQLETNFKTSKERDRIVIEKERTKSQLYMSLITLLLLLFLVVQLFRFFKRKEELFRKEKNKIIVELHHKISEKEYAIELLREKEAHTKSLKTEKEEMQCQHEVEVRKLMEETDELKALLNMYNENIAALEEKLSSLLKIEPKEKVLLQAKSLDFHRMAAEQIIPKEVDWTQLEQAFRQCDNEFFLFMRLKGCCLREKDKHACYLTRLGFPSKEMEILLSSSQPNISNLRSRLHQKLFSEEGSAKDFQNRIMKI